MKNLNIIAKQLARQIIKQPDNHEYSLSAQAHYDQPGVLHASLSYKNRPITDIVRLHISDYSVAGVKKTLTDWIISLDLQQLTSWINFINSTDEVDMPNWEKGPTKIYDEPLGLYIEASSLGEAMEALKEYGPDWHHKYTQEHFIPTEDGFMLWG